MYSFRTADHYICTHKFDGQLKDLVNCWYRSTGPRDRSIGIGLSTLRMDYIHQRMEKILPV